MQWEALVSRVGPILGFLVCITVVAELADGAGLFRVVAWTAARLARGSVLALWLLVVSVAALSSAVLSLDTTAVLITPVVIILARQLGLSIELFIYTAVWLANTASLILPASNLTNLLAVSWLYGEGARGGMSRAYAALMWPAAAAAFVITAGMLAITFRSVLTGRYRLPERVLIFDRRLFWLAAVVCAGLGPAFTAGVNVFLGAASGAVVLVLGCLIFRRSLLTIRLVPWRLALGVAVLFVAIQFAHAQGLDTLLAGAAGTGQGPLALLHLSGAAAVGANLVNNLPAYLALEQLADSPLRIAGLLVGTNAGPVVLPWGSLATLLWASRCRSAGVRIDWWQFGYRGAFLAGLTLLGGIGALVVVHS